jgi:hypothetical protein
MAWAIEEYKAILTKAYPQWYRAKGGERRKEVEREVLKDLEKVNRDRQAVNAPLLSGPKQGFQSVRVIPFLAPFNSASNDIGNSYLVPKRIQNNWKRSFSRRG